MTQPGTEPQSPGPLTNTLLIRPMAWFYIWSKWFLFTTKLSAELKKDYIAKQLLFLSLSYGIIDILFSIFINKEWVVDNVLNYNIVNKQIKTPVRQLCSFLD